MEDMESFQMRSDAKMLVFTHHHHDVGVHVPHASLIQMETSAGEGPKLYFGEFAEDSLFSFFLKYPLNKKLC